MPGENLDKIRGWLLFYVVWAAVSIAIAIYANGNGLLVYGRALPEMLPAGWTVFIIVLAFYGFYAWLLSRLVARKSGVVSQIKLMIALTPIVNAALPGIFAAIACATISQLRLASTLKDAYPPPVIGSIVGGIVIACIWYRYFQVSKRVRAIWPEEAGR